MAMIDDTISSARTAMEKAIQALENKYSTVRTGRASAKNLEQITVDYYGAATPITQIASVKTPEAHLLVVEPWDKSMLSAIEKAIQQSDLGITPSNDGMCIRLPFPAPTEERRKELVKQCSQYAEDTKVSIRNARRDANNKLEKACKAGEITEDEERSGKNKVQKLTDEFNGKVEETFRSKESEVMEI